MCCLKVIIMRSLVVMLQQCVVSEMKILLIRITQYIYILNYTLEYVQQDVNQIEIPAWQP